MGVRPLGDVSAVPSAGGRAGEEIERRSRAEGAKGIGGGGGGKWALTCEEGERSPHGDAAQVGERHALAERPERGVRLLVNSLGGRVEVLVEAEECYEADDLVALLRLGGLADYGAKVGEQPLHVLEQLRQERRVRRHVNVDGAVDGARVELLRDAAPEEIVLQQLGDGDDARIELEELRHLYTIQARLARHVVDHAPVSRERLGQVRAPLQRIVEQDEHPEQVSERIKGATHGDGAEGGGEELLLRRVERRELPD